MASSEGAPFLGGDGRNSVIHASDGRDQKMMEIVYKRRK